MLEHVEQSGIVTPVARGLHDDVLVESEKVAQREELLAARVARSVFALGREGEDGSRSEDVAMGIHCSRWHCEGRLRGIRVPVEPIGVFHECGAHLAARIASRRGKTVRALPSKMFARSVGEIAAASM